MGGVIRSDALLIVLTDYFCRLTSGQRLRPVYGRAVLRDAAVAHLLLRGRVVSVSVIPFSFITRRRYGFPTTADGGRVGRGLRVFAVRDYYYTNCSIAGLGWVREKNQVSSRVIGRRNIAVHCCL